MGDSAGRPFPLGAGQEIFRALQKQPQTASTKWAWLCSLETSFTKSGVASVGHSLWSGLMWLHEKLCKVSSHVLETFGNFTGHLVTGKCTFKFCRYAFSIPYRVVLSTLLPNLSVKGFLEDAPCWPRGIGSLPSPRQTLRDPARPSPAPRPPARALQGGSWISCGQRACSRSRKTALVQSPD